MAANGIDRSLFISPDRLHLTLMMLHVPNEQARSTVRNILDAQVKSKMDSLFASNSGSDDGAAGGAETINLRGLNVMNVRFNRTVVVVIIIVIIVIIIDDAFLISPPSKLSFRYSPIPLSLTYFMLAWKKGRPRISSWN